jgi:DNA-binding response OmpR family regulator
VVISLDRELSRPLLRDMRRTQALPPVVHAWGANQAYAELLTRSRPLAVLDVPHRECAPDVERRVAALRRLAPVVVLLPEVADTAAVLDAGATNVLARDMPVEELAVRLAADRRWLAAHEPYAPRELPPELLAHPASQRVLLSLLLFQDSTRSWCCHDLMLLLGSAGQPMSRAALYARMLRLEGPLGRLGLVLRRTGGWGRTGYSAVPASVPVTAPSITPVRRTRVA